MDNKKKKKPFVHSFESISQEEVLNMKKGFWRLKVRYNHKNYEIVETKKGGLLMR